MKGLAVLLAACAWPFGLPGQVSAQSLTPVQAAPDPRILDIPVSRDSIISLGTAPDTPQTVLFEPGEQIVSVILSDPAAYSIQVSSRGDSLALRPLRPSALALMSVRTTSRAYEFQLSAIEARGAPAIVRLVAGAAEAAPAPYEEPSPVLRPRTPYAVSGAQALRPSSISDDGLKTFIEWEGDRAMPATFALGPTGEEQMVDGYMREGFYTLDRVYDVLIFRIDRQSARAKRQPGRRPDGQVDKKTGREDGTGHDG